MLDRRDWECVKAHGIDPEAVEAQLVGFREGFPYLDVVRPASVGDGILRLDDSRLAALGRRYDRACGVCRVVKFVPASGAATRMFRELFGPILLFFRGIGSLLVHAYDVRKKQGFGAALKASAHYFASGIRRNRELLPRMAMYILPVLALAGMVTVVQNTIRQPYALEVQVNGQTVGYVANEDVFNSAREAVQERINYADTDHAKWTVEPTYTVTVAHKTMDENEMADAILKSASDEISEGTALYLSLIHISEPTRPY